MIEVPLCILPWVHFCPNPDGIVNPCCVNPTILGDMKIQTISEIWNGEPMKDFRNKMLNLDDLPESCKVCKLNQNATHDYTKLYNYNMDGNSSLRLFYNQVFASTFKDIEKITNSDGSVSTIEFKGWLFRISNKCNFKCRMCNFSNSSEISKEETGNVEVEINSNYIDNFISDHIDTFELIEFVGGETLLEEEHYRFLDILLKNKKTNINLYYNTNMSILKYKNKNVLDYWRQWNPEKLKVIASIDEIGDRAEYIRKGTNWKIVEKNLKILSEENFIIGTNIVASCLNVFRIPEIIQHLTDIGHINKKSKYKNFDITTILGGFYVQLLSKSFKEKIKDDIIEFIKNYNIKYETDIYPNCITVLNLLSDDTYSNEENRKDFLLKIMEKDKIRNENFLDIIPELSDIVLQYKNDINYS